MSKMWGCKKRRNEGGTVVQAHNIRDIGVEVINDAGTPPAFILILKSPKTLLNEGIEESKPKLFSTDH